MLLIKVFGAIVALVVVGAVVGVALVRGLGWVNDPPYDLEARDAGRTLIIPPGWRPR